MNRGCGSRARVAYAGGNAQADQYRMAKGTSVGIIEAHYGALLDTAHESLLDRLDAVR